MSGPVVPPPLKAHPLVSQWVSFAPDGTVTVLSGRVELGQGISTALTQMAADELDVSVDAVRLTQGHTGVSPAEGPTVGSLSVSFGGQSVRLASSAARTLMLRHAAGLLQTGPDTLSVEDGLIFRDGVETGLGYGALAGDVDLAQPVADHAVPKAPAARRIAGTSLPRTDLARRLQPGFLVHDMEREGMLHGRVIQPPGIDARLGDLAGIEATGGATLVRDARFLAVVAADEYRAVREAERLAKATRWEVPATGEVHPVDGLDGGISESEIIVETGYRQTGTQDLTLTITRPTLSHGSIGPSCAVAQWKGGHLTVWAHSQNVFALRTSLAKVLQVDPAQVEVIFAPGAGCYGHNSSDDVALDAALMSRLCGAPVRALCTREQEFQNATLAPAMKTTVTARLDAEGRMVAYDARVVSPPHSTRPAGPEEPNLRAAQFLSSPVPMGPGNDAPFPQGGSDRNAVPGYAIPAIRVVRERPAIVPYRPSALRGLGAFTNVIALEALVEACAEAAGQDSIDYRIAHLDDPRGIAVIEAVRRLAGDRTASEGVGFGIGYARYKNSAGYFAAIARVEIGDEVQVTDVWSAADVGETVNPDGTINQIEGGIVQAISWALKEEVMFAGGENLTHGWEDYPILTFSEVPRLHTELLVHPDAPLLGAGEIAGGPTGAAVVNAVRAALGVTPTRLPLTRHALVTLLS